jgi:hypothetical protein
MRIRIARIRWQIVKTTTIVNEAEPGLQAQCLQLRYVPRPPLDIRFDLIRALARELERPLYSVYASDLPAVLSEIDRLSAGAATDIERPP